MIEKNWAPRACFQAGELSRRDESGRTEGSTGADDVSAPAPGCGEDGKNAKVGFRVVPRPRQVVTPGTQLCAPPTNSLLLLTTTSADVDHLIYCLNLRTGAFTNQPCCGRSIPR